MDVVGMFKQYISNRVRNVSNKKKRADAAE